MALSLPTNVLSGGPVTSRPLLVTFVGQRPDGLYVCNIVKHGRRSDFTCCRSIAMQYLNRMDHPEPATSTGHHRARAVSPSLPPTEPAITYIWLVVAWLVIVLVAAYATLLFIGLCS